MIRASAQNLAGTCGVGLFYGFYRALGSSPYSYNLADTEFSGGAGWNVAGFIDNGICEEAYNILKGRHKIVFQAPVRRNRNSGHSFFFVVYDTKPRSNRPRWIGKTKGAPKPQALIDWENNPPAAVDNSQFSWPWN